jgi:N-acetylneuraminic acid mutarotase
VILQQNLLPKQAFKRRVFIMSKSSVRVFLFLFKNLLLVTVASLMFAPFVIGKTPEAKASSIEGDIGTWSNTGSMHAARMYHTLSLLPNGTLLVVGGRVGYSLVATNEVYTPASGIWDIIGNMMIDGQYVGFCAHTATALADGEILIAGAVLLNEALIGKSIVYNPMTENWEGVSTMNTSRFFHTATLMKNGKVLVTGGRNSCLSWDTAFNSTEIYDPATQTWSSGASMQYARGGGGATLLPNGKVLVAGGSGSDSQSVLVAELYDPDTNTWSPTGSMQYGGGNGILLYNGKVLSGYELYDPSSGTWSYIGSGHTLNGYSTSTLLPDGKVLFSGNTYMNGTPGYEAEIYDPTLGSWSKIASMHGYRRSHKATVLPDNNVLVVGGYGGTTYPLGVLSSAEIYNTGIPVLHKIYLPITTK